MLYLRKLQKENLKRPAKLRERWERWSQVQGAAIVPLPRGEADVAGGAVHLDTFGLSLPTCNVGRLGGCVLGKERGASAWGGLGLDLMSRWELAGEVLGSDQGPGRRKPVVAVETQQRQEGHLLGVSR